MDLFSRNWQWNCDPFQSKCKRFHEKIHARNDSFHYLEGCKSVCGTYGSIWPQPTGQSVIQHELKAFNIEDLAVKFDPKTTDQFLDEALTGLKLLLSELLILSSINLKYNISFETVCSDCVEKLFKKSDFRSPPGQFFFSFLYSPYKNEY